MDTRHCFPKDLEVSDFEVYQDGELQRITNFSYVNAVPKPKDRETAIPDAAGILVGRAGIPQHPDTNRLGAARAWMGRNKAIRPRLDALVAKLPAGKRVVLYSEHETRAKLAAISARKTSAGGTPSS